MPTPSEKMAQSLEALRVLQNKGMIAIPSAELSRTHRERLIKNGFLQEVIIGKSAISLCEPYAHFMGNNERGN